MSAVSQHASLSYAEACLLRIMLFGICNVKLCDKSGRYKACLGHSGQGLLHTQLIQDCGSSVVKEADSVPAEVTSPAICACMCDLDIPEVFGHMRLYLPTHIQLLAPPVSK